MIPGTLLSALFLAACLVPGFIFLSRAERHRARPARSPLLEVIELAGVGAATALIAVAVVLVLANWWGVFDASALADDPSRYALVNPVRVLGSVLVAFVASCGLARGAAWIAFSRDEPVFRPAATAWTHLFWEERKPDDQVVLTVELKDGRRVAGVLRNFSVQLSDREIALSQPAWQGQGDPQLVPSDGAHFVIVREAQIASITGRYITTP